MELFSVHLHLLSSKRASAQVQKQEGRNNNFRWKKNHDQENYGQKLADGDMEREELD